MTERHPDLERLIGLIEATGEEFDEQWVRDQIRQFAGDPYGPEVNGVDLGAELHLVENLGHKYIANSRWTAAARLFCPVVEELLVLFDEYPYLLDQTGDLLDMVGEAVGQLDTCLSHLADPAERRRCFRALFSVYRWDTEFGGLGVSERVPDILIRQGSEEERSLASDWTRQALEMHVIWAEHLIDRRGRDNYREAAAYLAEAKDRYRTMDREGPFNRAVEALRSKHHRLPAMQDEFDKARL